MSGILLGVLILYIAYSLGVILTKPLRESTTSKERLFFSAGLGLGTFAYLVLALGGLGFMHPKVMQIFLAISFLVTQLNFKENIKLLSESFRGPYPKITPIDVVIGLAFFVSLFCVYAGLLAPSTANDSLAYHLHLPKIYLNQGGIAAIPYEVNSQFPFLMEMLYTLGLAIEGVILAKFFHFATGLIAAGAIWTYTKRLDCGGYRAWCAILFLTLPLVLNQLTTTYVDVGLACFTILALIAFLRWVETQRISYIILSGVFSGFALSVKFLALVSVSALFLLILFELLCRPNKDLRPLGLFCFVAFVCSFVWYLRSYLYWGNPVYPYFYSVFKSGNPLMHYDDIGVSKSILSFLKVPWTMTMHPEVFEGFGVQLGPGLLAFLPWAIFRSQKPKAIKMIFFFVFYSLVCWFLLGQSMRFFLAAIPAICILIIWGLSGDFPKWVRQGNRLLMMGVLLLSTGLAVYHHRHDFAFAIGKESYEEYLEPKERAFKIATYVNEHLPANAKILAADETHLFYFERNIIREVSYFDAARYSKKLKSTKALFQYLQRERFTHILWNQGPNTLETQGLDLLRVPRVLEDQENELADYLDLLYTTSFTSLQGEEIQYRLYEIKEIE